MVSTAILSFRRKGGPRTFLEFLKLMGAEPIRTLGRCCIVNDETLANKFLLLLCLVLKLFACILKLFVFVLLTIQQ